MSKVIKKHYPADLQGESEHYRFTVNKVIQSSVDDSGNYDIRCEQYSHDDGKLLNDSFIFTDHKNKPFLSLNQLVTFIEEDAVSHFREKIIFAKDELEYPIWMEKLEAWKSLLQKVKDFIKENGEPIVITSIPN